MGTGNPEILDSVIVFRCFGLEKGERNVGKNKFMQRTKKAVDEAKTLSASNNFGIVRQLDTKQLGPSIIQAAVTREKEKMTAAVIDQVQHLLNQVQHLLSYKTTAENEILQATKRKDQIEKQLTAIDEGKFTLRGSEIIYDDKPLNESFFP